MTDASDKNRRKLARDLVHASIYGVLLWLALESDADDVRRAVATYLAVLFGLYALSLLCRLALSLGEPS